ncbi:MAG: YitT family protein [Chloroflexaceae bacterium]|nr:YitT family protein [Chloroflexaceae bacterium]NJO05805.1 YitT family protein [Chloroflexaceae bacterium]
MRLIWRTLEQIGLIFSGSVVAALGYSLFQIPFNLAAGGISGISIFIGYFTGWPEGTILFILNLPLMVLGFFHLGRWRFVAYTLLSVFVFSAATDLFGIFLPQILGAPTVTEDKLLAAVYAAIVTGIGYGLVYRASANPGGTAILSRIIQKYTGIPLGQIYLYTDGAIVLLAGTLFGWEISLLALLTLFLGGLASDYMLEGPSTVRAVTIVTDHPDVLAGALMKGLNRGVSRWNVTGSYTGCTRTMLLCTVVRSQVEELKYIVAETDPTAFVVIGNAHQALGSQFLPLKRR